MKCCRFKNYGRDSGAGCGEDEPASVLENLRLLVSEGVNVIPRLH